MSQLVERRADKQSYMVSIIKRPHFSTLRYLSNLNAFIQYNIYIFMNEYQKFHDIPNDVTK